MVITDVSNGNNVGEQVDIQPGIIGTLIASSGMGVTIFDLFGEILTPNDMKGLLQRNGIAPENYEGTRLAIRCLLLLLDLGKACEKLNEMKNEQHCNSQSLVKVEEIDTGYEEEQLDYENIDLAIDMLDQAKKPRQTRKRPSKSLNLCRGPGCNCGTSFVSREELQTHYLERSCFTCKDCDERFPSKLTLKDHIQEAHFSGELITTSKLHNFKWTLFFLGFLEVNDEISI